MKPQKTRVWFRELREEDPAWQRDGQSIFDWVSTSTVDRAKAARQFLNFNLSHLPSVAQSSPYRDLSTRWQSAFFELVVARMLQSSGQV